MLRSLKSYTKCLPLLGERQARYVLAGYSGQGQPEIQRAGIDLIAAIHLLCRAFGCNHFGTMLQMHSEQDDDMERDEIDLIDVEQRVAAVLLEDSIREFALLWSPPGVWHPRLVHTDRWDLDRVRRELFQAAAQELQRHGDPESCSATSHFDIDAAVEKSGLLHRDLQQISELKRTQVQVQLANVFAV